MDSLGEIISNLFFVHGISPYWINSSVPGGWSITVEMTFYLFIPFLFQKITTLNRAATFTVGSYIFAMGSRLLLKKIQLISDTQLWDAFLYYNFFNQLPIFGIGIILYFIVIKKDFKISTLNVLIITAIFIAHNIWNVFLPRYVLFSIGFILLIFTLSKKEYKLFVNQFTRFWGKISYSSYLVHFAILFWLDYSKIDSYINLIPIESAVVRFVIWYFIVLAFTSVISLFFYNTVELSFQRIGKKIIKALGEKNTTGDSHGANQLAEHKSENRMSMEGEVNSIEPVGEGANLLRR
jgi:peptidoglycan/LPS O-acetylase OafA/YrhL